MILYSPFEQFEIKPIYFIIVDNYDLSITNMVVALLIITFLYIVFFRLITKSSSLIGNRWQNMLENIYLFILNLVLTQSGKKSLIYFPHFFTIFCCVLLFNCLGLLPFFLTVSSHLVITLGLALSYFIAWIIIAVKNLGFQFLRVFCPRNMPPFLVPLLILIELVSFSIRPISMSLRLFANMLAGHILLHILSQASIFLFTVNLFFAVPAFIIVGAVGFLEIGISLLQAYIFTILLSIYFRDSLYSH
jgi:F-type H+-transporting ATPase subunit a